MLENILIQLFLTSAFKKCSWFLSRPITNFETLLSEYDRGKEHYGRNFGTLCKTYLYTRTSGQHKSSFLMQITKIRPSLRRFSRESLALSSKILLNWITMFTTRVTRSSVHLILHATAYGVLPTWCGVCVSVGARANSHAATQTFLTYVHFSLPSYLPAVI